MLMERMSGRPLDIQDIEEDEEGTRQLTQLQRRSFGS